MKPVIKLQTAQVDVSVNIVEGEPDECSAKDSGEDNSDDKVGVRHAYNNGKDGMKGKQHVKEEGRNCEIGLVLSALQCALYHY